MDIEYKKIIQRQGTKAELDQVIRNNFLAFNTDNNRLLYSSNGLSWNMFYNSADVDSKISTLNSLYLPQTGIDASKITSGTIDVARIPVLPSQVQVVSTGDLTALTPSQTSAIGQGTVVTTVDGFRYVYSGSGSKTTSASYTVLADITPEWNAIANRPTNISTWTNDSGYLNSTTLQTSILSSYVVGANSILSNSDSLIVAMGKLQGQINNHTSLFSNYLTTASAASTYLTITSAASTYLTQTNAASLYLGINANAASASKLQTARTIAGVSFDGSTNISIPYSNLTSIPSAFTPSAHNQAWSTITATPTTIAGYGITDALVYRTNNSNGVSRLYRADGADTYYIKHAWESNFSGHNTWRLRGLNDQGDNQAGIYTVGVDYADWANNSNYAGLLSTINATSTSTSTWNPQGLVYEVWGQAFKNTNISTDSGDITYWLRPGIYAGGAELCVMIDGDYYAGIGQYKVWHAGNFNPGNYLPISGGTLTGAAIINGSQGRFTKDAGLDGNSYTNAPLVAERSTTGTSTTVHAGIGFHNRGVNAAYLYFDASTANFKYVDHLGNFRQLWDTISFNPSNYQPVENQRLSTGNGVSFAGISLGSASSNTDKAFYLGSTWMQGISTSMIIRADEIRFGSLSSGWDWNQWAGLKYNGTDIFIGGNRWGTFNTNSNPSLINNFNVVGTYSMVVDTYTAVTAVTGKAGLLVGNYSNWNSSSCAALGVAVPSTYTPWIMELQKGTVSVFGIDIGGNIVKANNATFDGSITLGGTSFNNSSIANWNNASNNTHSHSFMSNLEALNQNCSTTSSPTFAGLTVTSSFQATSSVVYINQYASTQTILPATNNSYDLGASVKYWSSGFISTLNSSLIQTNGLLFKTSSSPAATNITSITRTGASLLSVGVNLVSNASTGTYNNYLLPTVSTCSIVICTGSSNGPVNAPVYWCDTTTKIVTRAGASVSSLGGGIAIFGAVMFVFDNYSGNPVWWVL